MRINEACSDRSVLRTEDSWLRALASAKRESGTSVGGNLSICSSTSGKRRLEGVNIRHCGSFGPNCIPKLSKERSVIRAHLPKSNVVLIAVVQLDMMCVVFSIHLGAFVICSQVRANIRGAYGNRANSKIGLSYRLKHPFDYFEQ